MNHSLPRASRSRMTVSMTHIKGAKKTAGVASRSRARADKMSRRAWRLGGNETFLIDTLPIVLHRADAKAGFTGPRRLGPAMAKTIGYQPVAFVANDDLWPSRIHPEDRRRVLARLAELPAGESYSIEYRFLCADESERIFLDRGNAVAMPDGKVEIHGACLDITDRIRMQQRLLWSQRLESIGRVMDDLAHDFLNMLSVTIWNLDGMMLSIENSGLQGRDRERVTAALAGATNGAALFKDLVAFSKRLPTKTHLVEPATLLKRMERSIRLLIGERAKLALDLPDGLWPIRVDEPQLEAMLVALVLHARSRVEASGMLRIRVVNMARRALIGDLPAGNYVAMTVDCSDAAADNDCIEHAIEHGPTPAEWALDEPSQLGLVQAMARHWSGQLVTLGDPSAGIVRLILPRVGGSGGPTA